MLAVIRSPSRFASSPAESAHLLSEQASRTVDGPIVQVPATLGEHIGYSPGRGEDDPRAGVACTPSPRFRLALSVLRPECQRRLLSSAPPRFGTICGGARPCSISGCLRLSLLRLLWHVWLPVRTFQAKLALLALGWLPMGPVCRWAVACRRVRGLCFAWTRWKPFG